MPRTSELSSIQDSGSYSSKCGYCKSPTEENHNHGIVCFAVSLSWHTLSNNLLSYQGMLAMHLTARDYQGKEVPFVKQRVVRKLTIHFSADLVDLGWRRSGSWVYKVCIRV
jgi:hypothetical protein